MIQPTQLSSVRASLMATASHRWLTGLVAGLSITTLHAVDWNGASSQDWNTAANWTPVGVPNGANAVVKVASPNFAKISATMTGTPVDIIVGTDAGADSRLDHVAGTGNTGNGNWMFVGRNGGKGVYNLADPAGAGPNGTYTGMPAGTGTMNVKGRLYVSGNTGTGSTGTVRVNTSGTLAIGAHLEIATNTSAGSFLLDAGTVTVGDWMEVGNGTGCTGTFNMSGGTLTKGNVDGIIVGANGATGTATITGGSISSTVVGGNGQFRVANNAGSNGTLNLSGTGSINVTNEFWVGNNASTGTFNFSGGTVTLNNYVAIGRRDGTNAGGTGNVTMSGGTWTKTGDSNFIIGASGNGTMTMSGGIVDVGTSTAVDKGVTWIGEQNNCTGSLTLSGTADFRTARITLAVQSGTTGTLNLDGGIARVGQITGGAGTDTVHFNGTQLIARGNQTAFVTTLNNADIKAGGLNVDTNGFNVVIPQVLAAGSATGGVIKSGNGTLTVKQVLEAASGGNSEFYFNGGVLKANTGANTNFMAGLDAAIIKSGGATIDTNGQTIAVAQNLGDGGGNGGLTKTGAGTLQLNGSNSYSGTTTVTTGTLGGTGSVAGPLVVSAGASLSPGASAGTFTAGATTVTGTYVCEIDGANADKLAVNGALNISAGAVLDFNVLAAPTAPAYVIASYASLSGTFTVQDLPAGYTVNYHYNDGVSSNNIALVTAGTTPYDDWTATYFPGVTDQNIIGPAADPDKDGSPNSLEFALGGVPNNGSSGPKVFQFAADGSDAGTEKELLMTIAVRGNPTFSAGPAPTATVDGFTYTVKGSLTLGSFTSSVSVVTPVAPPVPNDQPPAGYVWRTFSLDGSNNLPGKGFLRVSVD